MYPASWYAPSRFAALDRRDQFGEAHREIARRDPRQVHRLGDGRTHRTAGGRLGSMQEHLDAGGVARRRLDYDVESETGASAECGENDHLASEVDCRHVGGWKERAVDSMPVVLPSSRIANHDAQRIGQPTIGGERGAV